MTRWEYHVVDGACDLAELGRAGWELVSGSSAARHVFRRPAAEDDPTTRFTLEQREDCFAGRKAGGGAAPRLLNPDLAALVRRVGHTDMLLLADQGFPMPRGPETLDLSLTAGVPTILQVMEAIRDEFAFDRIIAAEEMFRASPARDAELRRVAPHVAHERPEHIQFKHLAAKCRAAVRTGDSVAYANIILVGA